MDGFSDKAKAWVNNAMEARILTQADVDELCAANEADILLSGDTPEAMRATVAQIFSGPDQGAVEAAKAGARALQDSRRNVKCNPAYRTNPPGGAAGAGAGAQAGGRRRRKSKRPRRKVRKSKRRSRK